MYIGCPRRCLQALLSSAISLLIASPPTPMLAANNPATTPVNWTLVLMSPTVSPRPFQGSDGRINLIYELVVTNMGKHPAKLKQLQVLNGDNPEQVILPLDSQDLQLLFRPAGSNRPSNLLEAGRAGIVWLNLTFAKPEEVPRKLLHRICFDGRSVINKPDSPSYTGAELNVDERAPIIVGPPLRGGGWLALNCYSSLGGHRRALLPINNKMQCSQRYAIDWMKLDDQHRTCTGNRTVMSSYPAYGQPVLAVADATVAGVVEGFADQPIGKLSGDPLYPGANTITLDLGNGTYGFYAHLKPGSIKVHEGDKVKRGLEIARLGNTGNSSAPHLHFHVTDGAEALGSNGIPYVFDSFMVEGKIKDFKSFIKAEQARSPHPFQPVTPGERHQNELPKEATVVSFP
ncbi:MAG: M23 family metallopeptidase [Candidatus Melainabacteria bacterium]|nr:M23 family metallopeptidase [Candidatus Melainabacteria bacterium]